MEDQQGRPEDAGRELRSQILNLTAAEAGISPSPDFPQVWGVVIDWPIGEQIATVVALADGHASLYTTSTFGIIGGGAHEQVRAAAQRLVRNAGAHLAQATPAEAYPYPNPDQVFFFLLTHEGVRGLATEMKALETGSSPLTSLFGDGQEVLTQLRLTEEGAEGGGGREKLAGIPGYLHCLLTAMSDGMAPSMEISAAQPVPNLEELTAGDPGLNAWIREQEFDYQAFDPQELIAFLKDSAKTKGLPFMEQKGEMPVIHALPGGGAKACMFDLVFARKSRSVRITLAPPTDPRVIGLQAYADDQAPG